MKISIKSVILWPKTTSFEPRIIRFEKGVVNVITGASRTGKSAVIPIIDYCLGSDHCSIPVGIIRDTTEWFGVLFEIGDDEQILLARREPGKKLSTNEMYVARETTVAIPSSLPGKNATTDYLKTAFADLAGLTGLRIDPKSEGNNFLGRPSFRDMMAFVFQPQNVIANPDTLFYKADAFEHREKLKNIFPFVLGSVSPEKLFALHKLNRVSSELEKKRKEFQKLSAVSLKWVAELQTKVVQAQEIGLLATDLKVPESLDKLLPLIRSVIADFKGELHTTKESISASVSELASLATQERRLSNELFGLRRKLLEITRLEGSSKLYEEGMIVQRDRLRISEWLSTKFNNQKECPLCEQQPNQRGQNAIEQLTQALHRIEERLPQMDVAPAVLHREVVNLQAELSSSAETLSAVQDRRRALEFQTDGARQHHYTVNSASRFVGGLEEALNFYEKLGQDGELSDEISELESKLLELKKIVNEREIKQDTQNALRAVEQFMTRLLPLLDIENPDLAVEISITDLTVRVIEGSRKSFLWEVGSGSNWLGYHIATLLAFHKYFLTKVSQSAVPAFLILDQPSQVYFPKVTSLSARHKEELDPKFADTDVKAVRKVFETLSAAVKDLKGQFQVIVMDHAAETVWSQVESVHLVEEWRNDNALIPKEWQSS